MRLAATALSLALLIGVAPTSDQPTQTELMVQAAFSMYEVAGLDLSLVVVEDCPDSFVGRGRFLPPVTVQICESGDLQTVIHELAHAYDRCCVTDAQRDRFKVLIGLDVAVPWRTPDLRWEDRPSEQWAVMFTAYLTGSNGQNRNQSNELYESAFEEIVLGH